MTHSDIPSDTEDPHLAELVLRCQQSHAEWSEMQGEARAVAGAQYKAYLEELWYALADDLRVVARGWMRSNIAPDMDSLAL
ncbi:MAG TPA: hypothetical protein VFX76_17890, partial [Roseiflexaceae bacterium]|nr:hypothetical protein [Roseiflexaceae bacterium]